MDGQEQDFNPTTIAQYIYKSCKVPAKSMSQNTPQMNMKLGTSYIACTEVLEK